MGDEMHQRNVACTGPVPAPARARARAHIADSTRLASVFAFIAGNDQFFLNVAMAMGKAMTDPVRGIEIPRSSPPCAATAPISASASAGPATVVRQRPSKCRKVFYFPGFSAADANPDMGTRRSSRRSASAASPWGLLPPWLASSARALLPRPRSTRASMREITVGENPEWSYRRDGFCGVPTGIDVRLRGRDRHRAVINTGIAHREPGIGQVGAGIVKAPMACFTQAAGALAERLGV